MRKRFEEGRANQGKRRASRSIAQVRAVPRQNETNKVIELDDANDLMEVVSIYDKRNVVRGDTEKNFFFAFDTPGKLFKPSVSQPLTEIISQTDGVAGLARHQLLF
jgi:hypothetical protein